MTDTTVATASPPVKGAAKPKAVKPKRAKASNSHPKYVDMTVEAINALKERNGSSRQAILKFITTYYSLGKDTKIVNTHLKLALKRGVATGILKHAKGQGASGSFRVSSDKKGGSSAATQSVKSPAAVKKSKVKKAKAVTEKAAKKVKTSDKKKKAAVAPVVKPKKEKKVKTPSKKSSPEKKKSAKGVKKVKSPSKKTSSDKKKKGGKGGSSKKSPKKSVKK